MFSFTRLVLLAVMSLNACDAIGKEPASSAANEGADRSLILHYRFDGDPSRESGPLKAKDLSGNHNDGKIVHAQWLEQAEGRRGVLRFDGSSAYLEIPASPSLGFEGDMSFEMWVRWNGPAKTKGATLFGEAPPLPSYVFFSEYGFNLLLSYRGKGAMGLELTSLPAKRRLIDEHWAHVAVVVEYPRCRFYRNGELVTDQYMPVPGIVKLKNPAKLIGGNPTNQYFSPIDLGEFRLYRRALSPEEVAAHAKGEDGHGLVSRELAVEPDWYQEKLSLRLVSKGDELSGKTGRFTVSGQGKSLAMKEVPFEDVSLNGSRRFAATAEVPLAGLDGKTIKVIANFPGDGNAVLEREMTLARPDWIRSEAGKSDKVQAPWTPLKAARKEDGSTELKVWGRTYLLDSPGLPRQVMAAGSEILAAPGRLIGSIDGKPIAWEPESVKLVSASETAAEIERTSRGGPVTLTVRSVIEYDGYLVYDCTLESREKVTLDNLHLDLPLKTAHAGLCYGDKVYPLKDKDYIGTYYSGAVKGDLGFNFSPNIWIGDDDRGLLWQAESDEHWSHDDPQKAIEIQPRGETTLFRANLVNKPVELQPGKPLRYRFALLATPVKPLQADGWSLRLARYEPWGTEFDLPARKVAGKPELEVLAGLGIRRLFTNFNDIWPWPMPVNEKFSEALHRLLDAAHRQGLKLHPYLIHQRMPVVVPEFDIYGLNMANRPLKNYSQPIPWPPNPGRPGPMGLRYGLDSQSSVFMCPKSEALRDAYIHSLDQRLREYGDDGVYLDGTVHIVPCQNLEHGCGYRDSAGKIKPTYPVFAIREMMKRIHTVVKSRKPDGIVDVHSSFGYNPAGLAWADIMWTGEQWHHLRNTGTDHVASALTLDKFRTEFTGRQIGIAAETLHYRLRNPMKIAATSLLHEISPRYSTSGFDNITQNQDSYFALVPALWKMRDDFDAEHAEKLFYWNNQAYVAVSPAECHATLLTHPRNGVLAFVSNLSRDSREVKVRFDLKALGLDGREIKAFNALNGEPVAMSREGEVSIALASENWIYLRLKPEGAPVVAETGAEK